MLRRVVVENKKAKKLKNVEGGIDEEALDDSLEMAAKNAFERYTLVLINFEAEDDYVKAAATMIALESFLLSSDFRTYQ